MTKFSLASIKESLRIINVISFGVYRAASKERLMYGFLILSVFFVLLSSVPFMMPEILQSPQVVLPFSPRTEAVIIGFTWVNIFLMLISIFISLNVLQDILSKDSIAMLLSKPIRRWQIIEGIFFGLFKICLLNWFVMSASLWLVIFYHGNEAYNHIWLGTSVSLLLIMIYISLVMFFYILIPNAVSGILSFFIIIAGFGASLIEEAGNIFSDMGMFFSFFANLGIQILPKINSLFKVSMKLLRVFELEYVDISATLIHTVLFLIVLHIITCIKYSRSR